MKNLKRSVIVILIVVLIHICVISSTNAEQFDVNFSKSADSCTKTIYVKDPDSFGNNYKILLKEVNVKIPTSQSILYSLLSGDWDLDGGFRLVFVVDSSHVENVKEYKKES